MAVTIKLAKMGNGVKVHTGWEIRNENGTIHHIATDCNTYPFKSKARLIGEIVNVEQITCPTCRKCMEKRMAAQ